MERRTQKKFLSSQMGIEPMTFRVHTATENAIGEQWSIVGYVAQ